MTLGVDHERIRVLSRLSRGVVGALLDEDELRPAAGDPFGAAFRRYHDEGHPLELTRPWRRAIAPSSARSSHHAAGVLRLLARDLLTCVAASRTETGIQEPAGPEEPPPNVRPIDAGPVGLPSLELASDGTWRPAASSAGPREEVGAGHRPAYVPTLGSRYPNVSTGPAVYTTLPSLPDPAVRDGPVGPSDKSVTQDPGRDETTPGE